MYNVKRTRFKGQAKISKSGALARAAHKRPQLQPAAVLSMQPLNSCITEELLCLPDKHHNQLPGMMAATVASPPACTARLYCLDVLPGYAARAFTHIFDKLHRYFALQLLSRWQPLLCFITACVPVLLQQEGKQADLGLQLQFLLHQTTQLQAKRRTPSIWEGKQ